MILPDWKIEQYVEEGKIEIEPFSHSQVQPHSYDLRLGRGLMSQEQPISNYSFEGLPEFNIIRRGKHGEQVEPSYYEFELPRGGIHSFCLGTTLERIKLPDNIVAQVDGKSTLGRLGLSVHQTAGWIDAGFNGNITLELNPVSDIPVRLTSYMLIAQIIFMETEPARRPYGHPSRNSHYQNQKGVTEPRGIEDL